MHNREIIISYFPTKPWARGRTSC